MIYILRDIHEGYLLLEDADNGQSNFATELMNLGKGKKKTPEKKFFLNNLELFVSAREKVLNNFKSRLFSMKKLDKFSTPALVPESAREPTKHKTYKLK